jgi:acylphosphatase
MLRCALAPSRNPRNSRPQLTPRNKFLPRPDLTYLRAFATISTLVDTAKKASRFFVTGLVQGVGFRFFAQGEAELLGVSGYVRNRRDGRVEAYAIGSPEQLAKFRARLEKGPRLSSVKFVAEERADIDSQYESAFVTTSTF